MWGVMGRWKGVMWWGVIWCCVGRCRREERLSLPVSTRQGLRLLYLQARAKAEEKENHQQRRTHQYMMTKSVAKFSMIIFPLTQCEASYIFMFTLEECGVQVHNVHMHAHLYHVYLIWHTTHREQSILSAPLYASYLAQSCQLDHYDIIYILEKSMSSVSDIEHSGTNDH